MTFPQRLGQDRQQAIKIAAGAPPAFRMLNTNLKLIAGFKKKLNFKLAFNASEIFGLRACKPFVQMKSAQPPRFEIWYHVVVCPAQS